MPWRPWCVIGADGKGLRRLKSKPDAYLGDWSPNGRRLAVWRIYGAYNNRQLVAEPNNLDWARKP